MLSLDVKSQAHTIEKQPTAPPCGLFLTSFNSYCQGVTNCTKQVLTNQSKRMFALLTSCQKASLLVKQTEMRELWPAGCMPSCFFLILSII